MSDLITVRDPTTHYWVCKVVLHMGRQLQMSMLKEGEHATAQALVDEGQWLMLSDGTICEPVKECSEEPQAHELRGRLAVWYPAEDFRVVMTADTVPV